MDWIHTKDKLPETTNKGILFCTDDDMVLQGFYDPIENVWIGYLWTQKIKTESVRCWISTPKAPSERYWKLKAILEKLK